MSKVICEYCKQQIPVIRDGVKRHSTVHVECLRELANLRAFAILLSSNWKREAQQHRRMAERLSKRDVQATCNRLTRAEVLDECADQLRERLTGVVGACQTG